MEEWRVVNEIELHPSALSAIQHRAEAVLIVERNGNTAQQHLGVGQLRLFIFREIDSDRVAEFGKGLGKGADNISQSAGLGKWHAF